MKNNRGISLLFVMAALIVTGFVGSALLRLTFSDRQGAILYSQSDSARNAARSGIISAMTKLASPNADTIAEVLSILNTYADAYNPDTLPDSIIWLRGGPDSWESLSGSEKYRTYIAAFHPETYEITLVSDGIGSGDSKASAVALYDLGNLIRDKSSGNFPTNAIQMDNGNFEFNCNLFTVNGNTSVKNTMKMHSDGVFNGLFRIDTMYRSDGSKAISTISFGHNTIFDTTAYFAGGFTTNGSGHPTFLQNAGFEGHVGYNSNNSFTFTNGYSIYFNGGAQGQTPSAHNVNNAYIYAYGSANDYKSNSAGDITGLGIFSNKAPGSTTTPSGTRYDIPAMLGINRVGDPQIHFNRSLIDTIYRTFNTPVWGDGGRFSSDDLISMYNTAAAKDSLWRGFLVLRFAPTTSGGYQPFKNTGTTPFNKKVILIIDDRNVRLGQFYESNMSTGNTVVFIPEYPTNENIFTDINNFRGLFYVKKSLQLVTFQSTRNLHMKGSVYCGAEAGTQFNSGNKTITFDSTVINEIAAVDLFSDSTSTEESEIKLSGDRIVPSLLSQAL